MTDFVATRCGVDAIPTNNVELYKLARTSMTHSVGFCEEIFVVEIADVAVDFVGYGDRVRAPIEVPSTVIIDSARRFLMSAAASRGGRRPCGRRPPRICRVCGIRLESAMRLVQGDMQVAKGRLRVLCCYRPVQTLRHKR